MFTAARHAGNAAFAASLLALCVVAVQAQSYPSRPVRYIAPSSVGSGNDFIARVVVNDVIGALGQQVIVDNRAGAGGNVAAEIASRAAADGYTLMQVSSTLAINASITRNMPWDLVRDFTPVTLLAMQPNLVAVHAGLPVNTIADLVRLARSKPGAINYSSAGPGSNSFLAAELLNSLAGIKMVHVPYKGGGPAMTAAAAGETALMIGPPATALPLIQQGKLRGIAISSRRRLAEFPQWPTVAETVPGYEFDGWYGLLAPARTPRAVTALWQREVNATLAKPGIIKLLNGAGYFPTPADQPVDFGLFMRAEIAKLGKIVQQTGAAEN
jgi:tripartite-type tricarboxylate transporter receptor subunit TctC